MTERQFWMIVYRALQMVCKAIKERYLQDEPEQHPAN